MKYIKGYLPKKKTGKGRVRKYNVMEDYEVVGRVLVDNQGSRSPYSISYRNDDESISFEGTLYKIYKKAKASGRNYVSHYDMRLSYINHDFIGNDDDYEEKYMFQSKDQWGGIIDAIDFAQNYVPQKDADSKKSFRIPIIGGILALASAWIYRNR